MTQHHLDKFQLQFDGRNQRYKTNVDTCQKLSLVFISVYYCLINQGDTTVNPGWFNSLGFNNKHSLLPFTFQWTIWKVLMIEVLLNHSDPLTLVYISLWLRSHIKVCTGNVPFQIITKLCFGQKRLLARVNIRKNNSMGHQFPIISQTKIFLTFKLMEYSNFLGGKYKK